MAEPDRLLLAVPEVLFREWDPIGVNGYAQCRDEYDAVLTHLARGACEYSTFQKRLARLAAGIDVLGVR